MKRESGLVGTAVLILMLLTNVSFAGDYGFKLDEKQDAVVAFALEPPGARRTLGSGFLLDEMGYVVTTCGVLNGDCSKIRVRANGGDNYFIKKLVARDESLNLVKILLDVPAHSLPKFSLSEVLPSLDETLFVLGRNENEKMITKGVVSALHFMGDGRKLIEITAPPSESCCGGPVVNTRGQVIGVSSPILTGGRILHTVIPIRYAHDLGTRKLGWGWDRMQARDIRFLGTRGNLFPVEWMRESR